MSTRRLPSRDELLGGLPRRIDGGWYLSDVLFEARRRDGHHLVTTKNRDAAVAAAKARRGAKVTVLAEYADAKRFWHRKRLVVNVEAA